MVDDFNSGNPELVRGGGLWRDAVLRAHSGDHMAVLGTNQRGRRYRVLWCCSSGSFVGCHVIVQQRTEFCLGMSIEGLGASSSCEVDSVSP